MRLENFVRLARAYCAQQLPWFAPALFRCRFHFTEQVDVAAIDGHFNIYFNPLALQEIQHTAGPRKALEQLGFIWIHEICHVLREHSERSKEMAAETKLWNLAADLEINDSDWPGLSMPDLFPGMRPEHFRMPAGKITEYYYRGLEQMGLSNIDNALDRARCSCLGDLPDEGSGVHGEHRPWEKEAADAGQHMEDIESEMVRRSVARQMQEHQTRGTIPAGWQRWAEEKLQARVDWRRVLRHRMSMAISQGVGSRIDYSFRRPHRRQAVYQPILPPALNGDLIVSVACVVDTSGSMGMRMLAQAVAEVCAVLETFRVPVTIIPCDARAYDPIRIAGPSDYVKLQQMQGGGGTDMVAGIEAAMALKPTPDTILVLTDGYTPYPPRLYKTPVIFGIFTLDRQWGGNRPPNPPWKPATIVDIPLETY